ncbi:MAG: hypothetical protein AABY18_03515 [Candidatus Thermoplasmatota archaeon]
MSALLDNESIIRWLHILSGITWIGMLYFFNLVNLPLLKFQLKKPYEANMAEKATGPILVKSLFWFRWGAAFTVLFGLLLLEIERQETGDLRGYLLDNGLQSYAILMGVFFGLVMAFNVWFIIWPRQQKVLANNKAIAASSDEAQKKVLADANAPMVKEATLASRTNTWLSVPMLWGMVLGAHGYGTGIDNTLSAWAVPVAVLALILLLMVAYSRVPAKKA